MVEITYQMVLSTLQTIALIAAITYYLIIMRNSNKARRIQTVENLHNDLLDLGMNKIGAELIRMQWTDFDDFRSKYDSTVNPDNFVKRWKWWNYWNGMGYMLHEGLIDIDSIYHIVGSIPILNHWNKFGSIVKAQRELYDDPHWFGWWEYLASEITKKRIKVGMSPEFTSPDIYDQIDS